MQLEISARKENKVLQRAEAVLRANDVKITPSRKELLPKIAALLNTKEQLVVISKIAHPFGAREATVSVRVYESPDSLKRIELQHLTGRDAGHKKKPTKGEKPGKEEEKKGADK